MHSPLPPDASVSPAPIPVIFERASLGTNPHQYGAESEMGVRAAGRQDGVVVDDGVSAGEAAGPAVRLLQAAQDRTTTEATSAGMEAHFIPRHRAVSELTCR